jgi:hypothetical protein
MRRFFSLFLVGALFVALSACVLHPLVVAQSNVEIIELGADLPSPKTPSILDILGGDISQLSVLAEKYGIWQCVVLIIVIFLIRYVGNVQSTSKSREQFMQEQLERRELRGAEDMSKMAASLREADSRLKIVAAQLISHQDMIKMNGQLCHEIIKVMSQHNAVVEQSLIAITAKLETLELSKKRKSNA